MKRKELNGLRIDIILISQFSLKLNRYRYLSLYVDLTVYYRYSYQFDFLPWVIFNVNSVSFTIINFIIGRLKNEKLKNSFLRHFSTHFVFYAYSWGNNIRWTSTILASYLHSQSIVDHFLNHSKKTLFYHEGNKVEAERSENTYWHISRIFSAVEIHFLR